MQTIGEKSQTDAELVAGARAQQREAFDELTRRYFGVVYAVGMARLRNRDQAEDLAQEVFLRAWLLIDRLHDANRFAHWVTRIARNLAIDWQRRGAVATRLLPLIPIDEATAMETKNQPNARELSAKAEAEAALQLVLQEMPVEQREIILLHYLEGLSHREISRQLGVNQSTVTRQIERLLNLMRGQIDNVLRDMAKGLRPREAARARTLAILPALLSLNAVSKAALISKASQTAGGAAVAGKFPGVTGFAAKVLPHFLFSAAKSGGIVMGSSKIVVPVVAVALIGGAYKYVSGDDVNQKARTPVITSLSSIEPAELVFNVQPGRRIVLRSVSTTIGETIAPESVKQTLGPLMEQSEMKGETVQDVAITARDVLPDGSRTVEVETLLSEFRITPDPTLTPREKPWKRWFRKGSRVETVPYMSAFIGEKLLGTVAPDGNVEKFEGISEITRKLQTPTGPNSPGNPMVSESSFHEHFRQLLAPATFPKHPVKVGEMWTHAGKVEVPGVGVVQTAATSRFTGWKLMDGRKVAEVETETTLDGASVAKDAPRRFPFTFDVYTGTSKFYYDPDLGQVSMFTSSVVTELSLKLPQNSKVAAGESVRISTKATSGWSIIEDSSRKLAAKI